MASNKIKKTLTTANTRPKLGYTTPKVGAGATVTKTSKATGKSTTTTKTLTNISGSKFMKEAKPLRKGSKAPIIETGTKRNQIKRKTY